MAKPEEGFDLASIIADLKSTNEPPAEPPSKKRKGDTADADEPAGGGFEEVVDAPAVTSAPSAKGEAELRAAYTQIEEAQARFEEQKKKLVKQGKDLLRLKEEVEVKRKELADKEEKLTKATQLLLAKRSEVEEREAKLESIRTELAKRAEGLKTLEIELRKRDSTKEDLTGQLRQLELRSARLEDLERELAYREQHLRDLEEDLALYHVWSADDHYQTLSRIVQELQDYGLEVEEYKEALSSLRSHLQESRFDEARKAATDLMEQVQQRRKQIVVEGLRFLIGRVELQARRAEQAGITLTEAGRWLEEARRFLGEGNYTTAEYYLREADFAYNLALRGRTWPTAEQETSATAGSRPSGRSAPPEPTALPPSVEPPTLPQTPAGADPWAVDDHATEAVQGTANPKPHTQFGCPSCLSPFSLDLEERPVRVSCPTCQQELIITDRNRVEWG